MDPRVENMLGFVTTWAHFSEGNHGAGWLPESAIHGMASLLSSFWDPSSHIIGQFNVDNLLDITNGQAGNNAHRALFAEKWASDPSFFDQPSGILDGKLIHT